MRRGSAKRFDHSALTHAIWVQILELKINVQVDRVATDDNLADLPSRHEFGILEVASLRPAAAGVTPLLPPGYGRHPCGRKAGREISFREGLGRHAGHSRRPVLRCIVLLTNVCPAYTFMRCFLISGLLA